MERLKAAGLAGSQRPAMRLPLKQLLLQNKYWHDHRCMVPRFVPHHFVSSKQGLLPPPVIGRLPSEWR
jgi:hypothetical protein